MSAFTIERRGGVAIVTFDTPNETVNKISKAVGWEFEDLLGRLAADEPVKAIVLRSGKPDTFIAGADIEEFVQLRSVEEAVRLSRDGQLLMQKVAESPKPIVVAIHGACVGGGMELALACRYRVASDHPKTVLGLPEIQLGLLPGAGGSNRLPRLIGVRAALDIILAGKNERAKKAFTLGMVDELVPESILLDTAVAAAEKLARGWKPPRKGRGLAGALLDGTPIGRLVVYKKARESVEQKTGGHYPAPLRALEVVRTSLEQGMKRGLEAEAQAFGELAMTDVSRRLVEIFFATTALKKDDGVPAGMARGQKVRRIGVVGSGFMGAGIAGTAALNAGVEVRLKDADLSRVGKGIKAATDILAGRLKRRRLTPHEYQRLRALLSGGGDFTGFAGAQIVIEAVFEDLAVKRQVIAELEAAVPPHVILATNTSTIPIQDIAAGARHPERVVGMHFFSPVEKMPLLEVIPTAQTSADAIVTAVQFGRTMGKTVIVVADSPGFWVNRILSPYLNEAGFLLEEGVPIETIDKAMTDWGFPVGPVALLDEVGLDVGEKGGKVMYQAFGDRLAPSKVIAAMRGDDRLGRKNGRGFYFYKDGHKTGADASVFQLLGVRPAGEVDVARVTDRLVYAMLNEAAMAMSEGVVRTPRDADIGAIFGIGFPPFRGGPLRTLDALGAAEVVAKLERLEAAHGPRFRAAPVLEEMARIGGRWYPADGR
ncbi:MAG TPA: fatty acid oxidation complex subunit alpha FadJ [Gemmatimonadales bacterium]|jgi:3-hydroxyacyl-CoA dehydrogenase/enoyl-CoA hydratase/3-hydroxybutyryl-CoA epimerase|nr:fatty acid oxidation complex subunit alpha FadJ [Gemmatimonadales bacterium]